MVTKSTRIRIEAEDAASAVFDQVADHALDRMKNVGDAGKFAIELGNRIDKLASQMNAGGSAAHTLADGSAAAETGLGTMIATAADAIIKFERLATILKTIGGSKVFGLLARGGVLAGGGIAVAGATAVDFATRLSRASSEANIRNNASPNSVTAGQHFLEFYAQAEQEFGRKRASQMLEDSKRYGVDPLQARTIFQQRVIEARQARSAEQAQADIAKQEADARRKEGQTRGHDAYQRLKLGALSRVASPDDPVQHAVYLEQMRIAEERRRGAIINVHQERELLQIAGDIAKREQEKADQKDRQLEAAQRLAEFERESARRGEDIRRRLMTSSEREFDETTQLFAAAFSGEISQETFDRGMLDIAARYAKPKSGPRFSGRLPGFGNPVDQVPHGGDVYSHSLTRGAGSLSPELVAQMTRKDTLKEIRDQKQIFREIAATLYELKRAGIKLGAVEF